MNESLKPLLSCDEKRQEQQELLRIQSTPLVFTRRRGFIRMIVCVDNNGRRDSPEEEVSLISCQ
jgi:hypothetical protein